MTGAGDGNRADPAAQRASSTDGEAAQPFSDSLASLTGGEVAPADLFDQQIWCWGQDVKFHGGNLLIRYGFQRIEKPRGSSAVSIYRLELSPDVRIILRGFGVFYGDERWGGLFLRRHGFSPKLTPAPDLEKLAWMVDDLPPCAEPQDGDVARSQRLLVELIDWIRRYEAWIIENAGMAYRRKTLIPWKPEDRIVTPAEEMRRSWRVIGEATESLIKDRSTHRN